MDEFTISMVNPQRCILQEIADKVFKRNSVAVTYAFCIKQYSECDFAVIGDAIVARWSLSGLEYIKKRAWDIVQGKLVYDTDTYEWRKP